MPYSCNVSGCFAQKERDGVKLFAFPTSMRSRRVWINFCGRERNWEPNQKTGFICQRHFIDGKPTTDNPDPALNPAEPRKTPTELFITADQSNSKIMAPPPLQKSVIVAPVSTVISNIPLPVLVPKPAIPPVALENSLQRRIYVIRQNIGQSGTTAQILPSTVPMRLPVVLLPPPLKRIPILPGLTVSSSETPPPIPKTVPITSLKRTAETRNILEKNGITVSATNMGQTSQSTAVSDEAPVPVPKKRKRKKRPSCVRPPTEEEIQKVQRFRELFRAGQSSSSIDNTPQASIMDIPDVDEEIVIESSPSPAGIRNTKVSELSEPAPMVRLQSPPILISSVSTIASSSTPTSTSSTAGSVQDITDKALEELRLKRARNNEAVRKSRLKARTKVKLSELNCRVLVKEFGELKATIASLEKELSLERQRNKILEDELRLAQGQAGRGYGGLVS